MNRSLPFAALLLATLCCTACVSTSTYEKSVADAAALSSSLASLKTEQQALAAKEARCQSDRSDTQRRLDEAQQLLNEKQIALDRAQADIVRVETVLLDRNQEAGKTMSQMRQEIDRLNAETEKANVERKRLEENEQRLNAENAMLQQERERLAQEKEAREQALQAAQATYGELINKMQGEIARGEVTISDLKGKLTVNMVEKVLFDSGSAELKSGGKEVLRKVGAILAAVKEKEIRVEGHSDNQPISPKLQSIYPSNWELSAARAISVVHFLRNSVDIPGERLVASGYGEFRPLADNSTAEGRAQNRRIQIILVPLDLVTPAGGQ